MEYFELLLDLVINKLFVMARVNSSDSAITLKILIQDKNTFYNIIIYSYNTSKSQTTSLDI
jgi:hypothetical protein